jgi:hypothetical protein
MIDSRDTDRIAVSGFDETDAKRSVLPFDDTAVIVLEVAYEETYDLDDLADTDRVTLPRARTQPHWPPAPPPPSLSRSRRHKAVYPAVSRPQTSSDS